MNMRQVLDRLQRTDCRLTVYRDSQGIPAVGWGHRVAWSDRLHLGDAITPRQAVDWLHADTLRALLVCEAHVADWDTLPAHAQEDAVYTVFTRGVGGLLHD